MKIRLYARRIYGELQRGFEKYPDHCEWLSDNKNRILNICTSAMQDMYALKEKNCERVFGLAHELTEQSGGIVNEDTVRLTEKFSLTSREYDLLPLAFTFSLLELISKTLNEPEEWGEYAPNAVRSLIGRIDYEALREDCLGQERILLKSRDFDISDAESKKEYRRIISSLARKSGFSESTVAAKALETGLTESLFGDKKEELCSMLGIKNRNANIRLRLASYISFTAAICVLGVLLLMSLGISPVLKPALSVVSLAPFSVFAVNIINRAILRSTLPKRLMRLKSEYCDTKENKCAVTLTVLFSDEKAVQRSLKTIEEYYSGNRMDNGVYLILADLFESDKKHDANDGTLTEAAVNGIKALNKKHGDHFALAVREREMRDGRFCGRERKRGALEELADFISGNACSFEADENTEALKNVRYICTLDADTVMPPESVIKLIGIAAHPANRYTVSGKSVHGYGLIQPNIGALPGKQTVFAEIMSPVGGIDSYGAVIGEVYNDFLHSGTFCGKGLFSVEAYKRAVSGKIRPNTVLSHDLLEGELLVSRGANDISFLDEFPKNPISYYKRRERWMRGDWMLIPWLFGDLGAVSKWKIFFNAVQTLFAPGVFLQILLAPFCGVWAYSVWAIAAIELFVPIAFAYADALRFDRKHYAFRDKRPMRINAVKRTVLSVCFLPFEAFDSIRAMIRALVRRFVTHKNVLQWNTYSSSAGGGMREYLIFFFPSCVLAAVFYAVCLLCMRGFVIGFLPFALWLAVPYAAMKLGQFEKRSEERLLPDEIHSLKLLTMRTQRFFFEALRDNDYLMPDNLQLKPYRGYAKRTSPTNMGFALLSAVCGLKTGAYSPSLCIEMLQKQLEAFAGLEMQNGHFFNWYDTETKKPLNRYISTVDSGNLCASLITVLGGLESIRRKPILGKSECEGFADAVASCLDGAADDFRQRIEEYSDEIYEASGKSCNAVLKRFLSDGIVASSKTASFAAELAGYWVKDFEKLSFSDKLFKEIDATHEFSLKPLREFLQTYPKSIGEILDTDDFSSGVDGFMWNAGREKYSYLITHIQNEYRGIYAYAYALNEKLKTAERYISKLLDEVDFAFLYDSRVKQLVIGADQNSNKNAGHYDMLMSESRLTSFVGIALGKLPAQHWFALSRPFTRCYNDPMCLSWSGTMFEYLMPDIFIKPTEGSMLNISAQLAVRAQSENRTGGIWGISESAFNSLDRSGEYKYKAFGVQKCAVSTFKSERVFSPYSTLLALEYSPRACMDNVIRFVENGMAGIYGFYESLDMQSGRYGCVYSHMAHHSGMSLCALVNYLYSGALRKYFGSNSFISATKVLLEEKMPLGIIARKEFKESEKVNCCVRELKREYMRPEKQSIESLMLSDGVTVQASSNGIITAYDNGMLLGNVYVYIGDEKNRSISYLPSRDEKATHSAEFYPGRAVYHSEDKRNKMTQTVSVEGNNIIISLEIENKTRELQQKKMITVLDTALAGREAYEAHPCFNGLSVEMSAEKNVLAVKNRKTGMCARITAVEEEPRFATDKMNIVGRGNGFDSPKLDFSDTLKTYPVTPCAAACVEVSLSEHETKRVDFLIFTGEEQTLTNKAAVSLALERARTCANAFIDAERITGDEWLLSLKLAYMATANVRAGNAGGDREKLWQFSLSERKPLLTVDICDGIRKAETILHIANYLIAQKLDMNILVLCDTAIDYLDGEYRAAGDFINTLSQKDSICLVKKENLTESETERIKGMSFAYIGSSFDIAEQLATEQHCTEVEVQMSENPYPPSKNERLTGSFDCGYGCFAANEYYIYAKTPMPWSNVIANEHFGTLVCENGGGYTWAGNSALNKLTPWRNDAVENLPGEVLYIRDNKLGRFWSITRDPAGGVDEHDCIFGRGYAVYRYNGFGMRQTQTVFVHDTVKVISVELEGIGTRDLSVFYYLIPVMGENENESYKYLEFEELDGMLCAKRNGHYMFIYAENAEYAAGSMSFIGNGTLKKPQAAFEGNFTGASGGEAGLALKINAHERFDIFMGYAESEAELKRIKKEIASADTVDWLEDTKREWEEICGRITVSTPDEKLNTFFNGWLMYQTLASRMLGRCGFYQAGGAYGFRDQLQDCLSLLYSQPERVKAHILLCAAHQFREGDVQHWWHPPYSGVRTRVSDDMLFLPYLASKYALVTGDNEIFDKKIPFLEGHSLGDRDDLYEAAWASGENATLYEHCMRAIRLVIKRSGKHSLPLMLGGDWNDGMNGIGKKGKGESVWLGWFLYFVISRFIGVCRDRSPEDAEFLKDHAKKLYSSLNTVCWDGQWYIRAFDDSGKCVGSNKNAECKIDAISQAWSVLSGASKPKMREQALKSLEKMLADDENGMIKLLDPPFDEDSGAGYICSYIPGVRENGGQYTHAAIWVASAFSQSGQNERCAEILDMLNPISHTGTRSATLRYKTEPYVIAADVYSNRENVGRGGWTWYTASASMYFCAVLNDLLGIDEENGNVTVDPHIPASWREYSVHLDNGRDVFDIKVMNPDGKTEGIRTQTTVEKNGTKEIRVVM